MKVRIEYVIILLGLVASITIYKVKQIPVICKGNRYYSIQTREYTQRRDIDEEWLTDTGVFESMKMMSSILYITTLLGQVGLD